MSFAGNNELNELMVWGVFFISIIVSLFFSKKQRIEKQTLKNILLSTIISIALTYLFLTLFIGMGARWTTIIAIPLILVLSIFIIKTQNFYVHIWFSFATLTPSLYLNYNIIKAVGFTKWLSDMTLDYLIVNEIFVTYVILLGNAFVYLLSLFVPEVQEYKNLNAPDGPLISGVFLKAFFLQYIIWGMLIFIISRAMSKKYNNSKHNAKT